MFVSSSLVRNFSSTSIKNQSLYTFKKQLDEFIYFNNLSSQWKPLVYRQRNADTLISLNALDKNNNPILPRSYPGIPSKRKLIKFINYLIKPEEIVLLRSNLNDLFKIRLNKVTNEKYLDQSIINYFLYKSYEIDPSSKLFQDNLMWLDQINENDSVFGVKNLECIGFIRYFIMKNNNDLLNYNDWFQKKMNHWIQKSKINENGSILYNAVCVIASNGTDKKALSNLENLTKDKTYKVYQNSNYQQYDHVYSILSALKNINEADAINTRFEKFLSDVQILKADQKSTYELLSEIQPLKQDDTKIDLESEQSNNDA